LRRVLLAVVLATLAAGSARAQLTSDDVPQVRTIPVKEEVDADMQAARFHLGPVRIIPTIAVRNAGYDYNVFGTTENPVSKFTQQLEEAERDPKVKAVVLRVNSPGGTVTSSDTLYEMITRFRAKTHKPVVTSAQEVMASGGYYVACASDKIVVQPTSIVGSVGVIFETMQFKGTMDKLGITARSIKSGSLKDMGSPFRLMRPDEEQVMQQMVDEYFTKFVGVVRSRRPVTEAPSSDLSMYSKEGYAGIYSGRVWSGKKAVELGLADRTGLLSDAIDLAKEMAHSPDAKVVLYTRPYGYGGSIYANSSTPTPQANVLRLEIPEATNLLPTGFYYLWRP